MRCPHLLLLCLFGLSSTPLSAQSVSDHPRVREAIDVIEIWLDAQRAYENIPAISAAVVHDQELVWAGATGMADPESGELATTQTAYSICSISKLFTATGVMQLRDAGQLRLDDAVADLLPWYDIREVVRWGASRYRAGAPYSFVRPAARVGLSLLD